MIAPAGLLRALALTAAVAALAAAAGAADKISDDAKAYQAELEAMKGQAPPKVLDKLASWKFELMDAWMAEGAASPDLKMHNKGKTKFSKKEMAELLTPAGKYKFALYGIQVAADSATMGTIDELGMSYQKDATVDLRVFTVVRITFRDDQLVDVRTWPKLESSSIGGGTWYLRHGPGQQGPLFQ